MAMNRRGVSAVLGGLGLAAALMPGAPAQACGGFFCAQPQNPFDPPPVAQTGENVLFAMERDAAGAIHLEAHVQIFYQGPADRFSWVVPVDSKPELDVGTNRLFSVLDPATKPSFGVNWHEEGTCKVNQPPSGGTGGAGGTGGGFRADAGASDGASAAPGVDISFRGDVGPYDAVVIRSADPNDPKPLKDWLAMNMYFLSPDGSGLIDDYVRENKWFVAIRLNSGRSVNEIQPLVMRFDGPSPCIPLKLTSIASINDLRVNLWVLAENRVVPQNYFEIKINPLRIDWFNNGSNYESLVKEAANQAGGNAFVADYVGPASMMRNQIYVTGRYDTTQLSLVRTPPEAMAEIQRQQIPRDAILLEILRKQIPQPQALKDMGISELQFYNQIAVYWQMNPRLFAPFSAQMLAADVQARIVLPLAKAQALFDRFPKLTRLSTFISPDEMTSDPLFMVNTTLPDVPARRVSDAYLMCGNNQYTRCEAPIRLEVPGGQQLFFKPRAAQGYCHGNSTNTVDRGQLDKLPALEVSYKRESQGEGAVKVSNRATIDQALSAHNIAARAPMVAGGKSPGVTPVGGTGGMNQPSDPDDPTPAPRTGSGCTMTGGDGSGVVLLLVLGAVGMLMRRRRVR